MSEEHRESEDRLLTLSQISAEFGVSRQTLHTARTRGAFPAPVAEQGSTRLRWKESAVADYFRAHPKRQGHRSDLERGSRDGQAEDGPRSKE
ncbi:helix-turn-helix transcriptional regulator [Streptomyces bacillaris]|uniref:helix-turn-helix transcriptional regulator n=1 Tax=Streptomyces bacillaris TaxID=68179 RepID=UPI003685D520